ncbi:putative isoflavone oxidoreductase [Flagelloscypha sp. PMI_526]|nr:putative isoflavone oxidoreductase [Flagelloscypha sp. PMI_526]
MSPKAILVLGAGELGIPILQNLAKRREVQSGQTALSVLLRDTTINSADPAKARLIDSLRGLNISFVAADLSASTSSVDHLTTLFTPFDTVIGCTGFSTSHNLQLALAQAVVRSGSVKRYIPWQWGIEYDAIGKEAAGGIFADQLDVRTYLRENQERVDWVIISTGMFMSFLFEDFFGVFRKGEGVTALGSWDTQVTVTAVEDIGRLAAQIVFDSEIRNQVVYVGGDTISYGRLAELVGQKKAEWTLDYLRRQLEVNPEDMLSKYRLVFAEGRGTWWDIDKTYNVQKAIEVTNVEQWLHEHPNVLKVMSE